MLRSAFIHIARLSIFYFSEAEITDNLKSQLLMPPYATTRKCEDEDRIDHTPCDEVRPDELGVFKIM